MALQGAPDVDVEVITASGFGGRLNMFFVGEVVKPSGKGRTSTWEGMVGPVVRVRVEGTSVFVQWHDCAVEDEMDAGELVLKRPKNAKLAGRSDILTRLLEGHPSGPPEHARRIGEHL